MSYQRSESHWHLLADRFIWYEDLNALSEIPVSVTDREIQRYIYMFHGDDMPLPEIRHWREQSDINGQEASF